jgi:hypothetical protein
VHFRLNTAHLTDALLEKILGLVSAHTGKCPLFLSFRQPAGELVFVSTHEKYFVTPSLALEKAVNELLGEDTYYAKVDMSLPEKARRSWEKKNGGGGGE